ncbi:Multi-sensor Hybrid Histidine Kinase [Fulvivirga imtechensis AK7]|uniref:histidine kinase n=1 Tax=Fulvivirga imtechensis AK7 TaxID=1237149 RepID=L8JK58_9BACT|nr:hybrid sensor histidine kinase/response regulator [Fulvivirga imtechensis]ELR69271.1 Multi-sensor Hybrid Histidine Kinase [Fulvivirga imtechensis AK7]
MAKDKQINVFLIDDDEDDFVIVKDYLAELNGQTTFNLKWESDYQRAVESVCTNHYNICLVDYRLGAKNGLDFIKSVRSSGCEVPLILLTGKGDREIDYEAMRLGASDYLIKTEIDASMLGRSIRYAISHSNSIKELNAKEEKYRSLFERSVDAIYMINKEHQFIDVNESMKNLLDYSKNELLEMGMKHLFHDQDDYQYFNQMLAGQGHLKDFEVSLIRKDNSRIICLINGIALNDNAGNVYGYQGIIHDLTMRKRAEEELLMAEKLTMTGQIARSMAHEVRNPLTNLNLALEQLRDEVEDSDDTALYFDIIRRNADRIEQLITEMLKSSKPRELNLEVGSLNDVIEEALSMTTDRIKLRGINLIKNFQHDLPFVAVDKEQLKTAFLNIIINAVEAMKEEDGILTVETVSSKETVSVCIKDNGKGIPKDEIKKLFDPFFTGKKGGMGLGLTSAQNIVNSHRARIGVESEVGKGTIFRITFPQNGTRV